MKILFVRPPFNSRVFIRHFCMCEPYEVAFLAASLGDLAELCTLDMRVDATSLEEAISQRRPDVVCFSAQTMDVNTVNGLAFSAKREDPEIITCVGGEHATFLPGDFRQSVDFVFRGDAVGSFLTFIKTLVDNTSADTLQVARKAYPRVISSLEPDYKHDIVPNRASYAQYQGDYIYGAVRPISLVHSTSGCPYRCTYCSIPHRHRKYHKQGLDRALALIAEAPTESLLSIDAHALADIRYATELYGELARLNLSKRLMISTRSDSLAANPAIVPVLKRAGVSIVAMGLETFEPDVIRVYNKRLGVIDNIRAVELLKKNGILVRGNFIVRQDFDEEDFRRLTDTVHSLGIEFPTYQILTPLPGTPLFEQERENIVVQDYDFWDLSHSVLPTKMDFRKFHREFQALFRRSYGIGKLARLAMRLPISMTVTGLLAAGVSHAQMSYAGQPGYE